MQKDLLQRFLFKNRAVRGCLLRLNESYTTILAQHHYPNILSGLLAETLLGVTLIADGFKQKGQVTLQFQGEGALSLLSARIDTNHAIKGLIRAMPDLILPKNLSTALNQGQMRLTYEGATPQHNYQSIIPVEDINIAKALEAYFTRSEQLPTRFFLASTPEAAAGLLLQTLPSADLESAEADFAHVCALADTLQQDELLHLDFDTLLHRLYHEEDLECFTPYPIHFGCNCTLEKMQRVIVSLGQEEAEGILADQAFLEITCEFCGHIHQFDQEDIHKIFDESSTTRYH